MPGLGRRPFVHPRSFAYNAAPALAAMPVKYRSDPWPDWPVEVDQGNSGTCTAAALLKMLAGRPIAHTADQMQVLTRAHEPAEPDPVRQLIMSLYRRNVLNDVWADNNQEADPSLTPTLEGLQQGSSIDAAMLTGRVLGVWKEFRWCRSLETASEWVRRQDGSPLLIGIVWTEDMFRPNAQGFVRPTGHIAGGHALKVLWHRKSNRIKGTAGYWVVPNSWGYSWGVNGKCYLSDEDFDTLVFRMDGECAVAVETD